MSEKKTITQQLPKLPKGAIRVIKHDGNGNGHDIDLKGISKKNEAILRETLPSCEDSRRNGAGFLCFFYNIEMIGLTIDEEARRYIPIYSEDAQKKRDMNEAFDALPKGAQRQVANDMAKNFMDKFA